MPRLVEMQEEYADLNLRVQGVSDADAGSLQYFSEQHALNFELLASAPKTRKAFGVEMVWGSTHYLVDPMGQVVAKGLDGAAAALDKAALNPPAKVNS